MKYYQWNFYGLVNLRHSANEVIAAQKLHAKDRWEAKLESLEIDPELIFSRIRHDGIWDTGLVATYLALCFKCRNVKRVQQAAERVFGSKSPRTPWHH
jgi:hypothetical protein